MKKNIFIVLICVLSLTMVACKAKNVDDISVNSKENQIIEQNENSKTEEENETILQDEKKEEAIQDEKVESILGEREVVSTERYSESDGGYNIQNYDQNDVIIDMTIYDTEGNKTGFYQYTDEGAMLNYEGVSPLYESIRNEFETIKVKDDHFLTTEIKTYIPNGSNWELYEVAKLEYYDSLNLKSTTNYDANGKKLSLTEYFDTEKLTISRDVVYNGDGSEAFVVTYDENGNELSAVDMNS